MMLTTMADIKAANREAGQVWFSTDTMAFWGTRLFESVYPTPTGSFFVTSDLTPRDDRLYSVRFCDLSGRISTLEFQEHVSLRSALLSAANHALAVTR